jgi:hypothetical protein
MSDSPWTPDDPAARRALLDGLPYSEDEFCQAFVSAHPGGATLEEVGAYLGVTRERVRQIVDACVSRLAYRRELRDWLPPDEEAVVEWSLGREPWRGVA